MLRVRGVRPQLTLVLALVTLLILAACGTQTSPTPTAPVPATAPEAAPAAPPAPTAVPPAIAEVVAEPEPAAMPEVIAEPAPAAMAEPEPAAIPKVMAEPEQAAVAEVVAKPEPAAMPEVMAEPEPTAMPAEAAEPAPAAEPEAMAASAPVPTPTPEPTPAPALLATVDGYGFSLILDRGADVRSTGWTEQEPNAQQGTISFSDGGVSTILIWGPHEGRGLQTFLADTYNILRAGQPGLTLDPISDGGIAVSGQGGSYGGFKTRDSSGETIGGGLIGAWLCPEAGTAFRLTLTGEDAAVVQLRFDRLLDNFTCAS